MDDWIFGYVSYVQSFFGFKVETDVGIVDLLHLASLDSLLEFGRLV